VAKSARGCWMAMANFEQLDVWQVAHRLIPHVYKSLRQCHPTNGMASSQMQRAAVSIPANIAERFKTAESSRQGTFLQHCQGSLEELRYYFILCRDLGYKLDCGSLTTQADQVGRMLTGSAARVVEAVC